MLLPNKKITKTRLIVPLADAHQDLHQADVPVAAQ
jgi:hypothetical protein